MKITHQLKKRIKAICKDDKQRYYYTIQHGIDTEHVAPLEMEWMEKIFSLVPDQLKIEQYSNDIQDLSETIRNDYQLSVKKAIVDFVLKDNRQLSVAKK